MGKYNPMQTLFMVFEPTDATQSYDLGFSTQYSLSMDQASILIQVQDTVRPPSDTKDRFLSNIFKLRFHPLLLTEITSFSMTPLYQCSEPTSWFQSNFIRMSIELVHECSYDSHHTCYKSQVFGRSLKPNVVYKLVYVLVAYITLRMLI